MSYIVFLFCYRMLRVLKVINIYLKHCIRWWNNFFYVNTKNILFIFYAISTNKV